MSMDPTKWDADTFKILSIAAALAELRLNVTNDPDKDPKKWIFDQKEIEALDLVMDAVEDTMPMELLKVIWPEKYL